MIALLGATAVYLTALQAGINAPTEAFRGCLREASAKATTEKVAPDAVENYLRSACSVQMQSLKTAVIAFRVKNGMAKKTAAADADMTVDDYVATPVEKYQFMAELQKAQQAQPAAQQQPQVVPAAEPKTPEN